MGQTYHEVVTIDQAEDQIMAQTYVCHVRANHVVRDHADVGEAFTLLTVPPGEDIAPYHNRQVALLTPPQWRSWLDGSVHSVELLAPNAAGTLTVSAAAA